MNKTMGEPLSTVPGWQAWRGLLWCEWYAHSKLLLLFLAAWLTLAATLTGGCYWITISPLFCGPRKKPRPTFCFWSTTPLKASGLPVLGSTMLPLNDPLALERVTLSLLLPRSVTWFFDVIWIGSSTAVVRSPPLNESCEAESIGLPESGRNQIDPIAVVGNVNPAG